MKTPIVMVGHMADNYARQIEKASMMIGVSGFVVAQQMKQTADEITELKTRMEIAADSINDLARVKTALKDKPASVNPVTRKFNFKKLFKQMKKLLLIFAAGFLSAQSLQPTIGLKWIGGFQYQMEVEAPGAQLGLKFTPKKANLIMSDIKLSFDYYADVIPEKPGTRNDFYQVKMQFSKPFAEYWSFQYYAGYSNAFDSDIMNRYSGPFKTNFSYGFGLQTSDDMIDAEMMFEMMSGYPMLSIGASYKFKNLIKKNR